MIIFRQKEHSIGAVVTVGSTLLGMKQSSDAKEQNEELAERQERDNAKLRKSLDNLANSEASPEVKQQAASLFSELKMFAAPTTGSNGILGFAKDLWEHSGGKVKGAVKMGAGLAAAGYVGNRIATSIKNHNEGRDDKNKSFLKKAALGAATVGGGLLAARHGLLGSGVKNFMTTGMGGKALNTAKNVLKENVSPISKKVDAATGKTKYKFNAMNSLWLAAPTAMYLAQKKMQGNQVQNTLPQDYDQYPPDPQQRQYANWINWTKNAYNHLKKNPKQALSGGFSKLGNFIGMMGGKGGTASVQEGFKKLENIGIKSGNKYTQALGRWGQNNPNAANLAAGAAAIGVGGAAFGLGGKIINKPMKAFDKEAYQMEEQDNDKI